MDTNGSMLQTNLNKYRSSNKDDYLANKESQPATYELHLNLPKSPRLKLNHYTSPHSKGRKRKCLRPSHFSSDEEANGFDADVDDSSRSSGTVEQKLCTTFQSGTATTWASSSGSSKNVKRTSISRLMLATPPRLRQAIDCSSCSELSPLSYDGTMIGFMNSSISSSSDSGYIQSPLADCKKTRKRIHFSRTLHSATGSVMKQKKPVEHVSLMFSHDQDTAAHHSCRNNSYVSALRKASGSFLQSRRLLMRLFVVIIVYSIVSFHGIFRAVIEEPKIDTHESEFLSNKHVVAIPSKNETDILNNEKIDGIEIHRLLGGLQFISDNHETGKDLGGIRRGWWGLGEIDVAIYEDVTSYKPHDPTIRKPRVVFLNDVHHSSLRTITTFVMDSTPFSDNTQLYGVLSSDDEALSKMEVLLSNEDGECISELWQKDYYPTCNSVHEFDFVHIDERNLGAHLRLFEKQGYWRNAWRADLPLLHSSKNSYEHETFIVKTPRYSHNFEHAHYEHDRVDALAMSILTFSPYVVDIYSFCGRTVFTEFAGGPSLGSIFDKAKRHRYRRVEIARDLAIGLSHVHFGRNGDDNDIRITHFDINPANIVVTNDNTLRFNDFNIAQFVKRNTTSGEQCSLPSHHYPNAQWRSPEEVNEDGDLSAKADVFSLGHIFYRLICGHEPWNKLEEGGKPTSAELSVKVKNGVLPRIPDHIMKSKDPEVIAVRTAMLMCYTVEPSQRPTSKVVAKFLNEALEKMTS